METTDSTILTGVIMITLAMLLAWVVVNIFFIITLQNTLRLVKPQNRRMRPGQVWLLLIPVFSLVWNFIVVNRVAESIHNENCDEKFSFEDGSSAGDPFADMKERPTRSIGLAYSICSATAWIPMIGTLTGLGGFVCWIMYWVEVNKCRKALEQRQWQEQVSMAAPAGFSVDQY
ncbi:hypothetical protein [Flaviaesturariibacter terrae]